MIYDSHVFGNSIDIQSIIDQNPDASCLLLSSECTDPNSGLLLLIRSSFLELFKERDEVKIAGRELCPYWGMNSFAYYCLPSPSSGNKRVIEFTFLGSGGQEVHLQGWRALSVDGWNLKSWSKENSKEDIILDLINQIEEAEKLARQAKIDVISLVFRGA